MMFSPARLRRFSGNAEGNTAVEYAFVAPALILLMIGIFDVGLGALALTSLERVAKDGARFASVRGSESSSPATEEDVSDYVKSRAIGLDPDDITVSVTWTPGSPSSAGNEPGDTVTVRVTYDYDALLAGLLGPFGELPAFERASTLNVMN